MDGYILLERSDSEEDQGGECGLLIDAVYPILGNPELPTIVREPGFESTAIAKDCGNGATEIIFDSGEASRRFWSSCRNPSNILPREGWMSNPCSRGHLASSPLAMVDSEEL